MFGGKSDFRQMYGSSVRAIIMIVLFFVSVGCGKGDPSSDQAPKPTTPLSGTTSVSGSTAPLPEGALSKPGLANDTSAKTVEFKPLALSGFGETFSDATSPKSKPDPERQIRTIIDKLQPLQVLLGKWRGTTRLDHDAFKAVDIHDWVWDLRSQPEQPALTIQSDKSPYIRSGRITWDTEQNKFALTISDPEGATRDFTGDFAEPVHEIVGSDDKLHKVFRLEFNQNESEDSGESWQLAFAQQENNRYLLEVGKRRGKADFARHDTVSTQREGTSFAISDSGYAEKTCIISEGLGTMEVTYKGRSYWVCCSGCKAAFEEDPETWIARASKKDMPKKN